MGRRGAILRGDALVTITAGQTVKFAWLDARDADIRLGRQFFDGLQTLVATRFRAQDPDDVPRVMA